MAIIEKLALSRGGGIISLKQLSAQANNTASLLIGLGGTGIDCIREIKTEVYNRILPDDGEDATVANYEHIRFLGVDADNANEENENAEGGATSRENILPLDSSEFFPLSGSSRMDFVKTVFKDTYPEYNWRSNKVKGTDLLGAGAGAVRQCGRYLMMQKSEDFMSKVENLLTSARMELTEPDVAIHIFSGLGGGTGSGAFLDVCYMVQKVIEEQNIKKAVVYGYFFLPDVNISKVPSDEKKSRINLNGYAALQELDYCMNLERNNGSFIQIYNNRKKIEWNKQPVNYCHLISSINNAGKIRKDAYDYAMKVTSEYVLEFLVKQKSDKTIFPMRSHINNAADIISSKEEKRVHGYNLGYLTIGAASASIPMKEINTYLATRLFDDFGKGQVEKPNPEAVDFCAGQIFGAVAGSEDIVVRAYNALYGSAKGSSSENYNQWNGDYKLLLLKGNQQINQFYETQTSQKKGVIESSCKSLKEPKNEKSIISLLNSALFNNSVKKYDRGPTYALNMLNGSIKRNLNNIIDGMIETNQSNYNERKKYTASKQEAYDNAVLKWDSVKNLKDCRKNRKELESACDELCRAKYDVEQQQYLLYSMEKTGGVLKTLKKQIEVLISSYYSPLDSVYKDIKETFEDNKEELKRVRKIEGFDMPLIDINDPDMQKVLDVEYKKHDIKNVFEKFIEALDKNRDDWSDPNKLSKLVTAFFVGSTKKPQIKGEFQSFANKGIVDYLQLRYDTEDSLKIQKNIKKDCIKSLNISAEPLFNQDNNMYRGKIEKYGRISVPIGATVVLDAANEYSSENENLVCGEAGKDRIFILYSGVAFPISGILGISNLEKEYYKSSRYGMHYYEGMESNNPDICNPDNPFDDWRDLPFLIPMSLVEKDNDYPLLAKQLYDKQKNIIDKIIEYKMCVIDDHMDVTFYKIDEKDVDEFLDPILSIRNDINQFINNNSDFSEEELKNIIEKKDVLLNHVNLLKNKLDDGSLYIPYDFSITLLGESSEQKDVDRIFKDVLFNMPKVLFDLKPSIEKITEAQGLCESLDDLLESFDSKTASVKDKINEIKSEDVKKKRKTFIQSLFCGVIDFDGFYRVTFTPKDDLDDDEIVLCDYPQSDGQFQYYEIPPYQAFVSYLSLDEEKQNALNNMKNERMKAAKELSGIAKKINLLDNYSESFVETWNNRRKELKTEEEKESVKEFLNDLKNMLRDWCQLFRIS